MSAPELRLDGVQSLAVRADLAHMIAVAKQHLRDLEALHRLLFPGEHDGLVEAERDLIRAGFIITAIKSLHERTGYGLAEAKLTVDRYVAKQRAGT